MDETHYEMSLFFASPKLCGDGERRRFKEAGKWRNQGGDEQKMNFNGYD